MLTAKVVFELDGEVAYEAIVPSTGETRNFDKWQLGNWKNKEMEELIISIHLRKGVL